MRWLVLLAVLTGCMRGNSGGELVKVNIIDQNGLNETIQAKDRLARYADVDFASPQPYQKVLRAFAPDESGRARTVITSYHSNGSIHQWLDVVDGRACGHYLEWFSNGERKLEACVVAGEADLDGASVRSFVFDGVQRAWDQEGHLVAEIPYRNGQLEGVSHYFHPDGELAGRTRYVAGELDGTSESFWRGGAPASRETYVEGLLESGEYWNFERELVASVVGGEGTKIEFGTDGSSTLYDHSAGKPSGRVQEVDKRGKLHRVIHYRDGLKHGEEVEYFPLIPQPRLSVQWRHGEVQGLVKTWFPSGQLESQREMSGNRRNGVLMGYYENGALLLLEEYKDDRLVRGDYFGPSGGEPVSCVERGEGIATLYDGNGQFLQTIHYSEGLPS